MAVGCYSPARDLLHGGVDGVDEVVGFVGSGHFAISFIWFILILYMNVGVYVYRYEVRVDVDGICFIHA